ncbi:mitochondrial carrier protein [Echinococcus multilocularis]|uniref:Mitochondrial carrier protein n=1 Tax=Echinococcus multilocularis TaxID=6211 RepID=A0A068XZA0_ECHMU|nr:mitochondrial carrier protein [Echinococcus multilocularis]
MPNLTFNQPLCCWSVFVGVWFSKWKSLRLFSSYCLNKGPTGGAMLDESTAHILGGGIGGTIGAVCTSPLELIKVRFQSSQGSAFTGSSVTLTAPHPFPPSSVASFAQIASTQPSPTPILMRVKCKVTQLSQVSRVWAKSIYSTPNLHIGLLLRSKIIRCMLEVGQTEGYRALFKGLVPTLIGVLPSRGIYFCAYHEGQNFFQRFLPDGHSAVFMLAAGCGSITASTLTNPIWYVKTRLQLDSRPHSPLLTAVSVIRSTWREYGIRGFYRGISASYVGSIETALNFVLYENIKGALLSWVRRTRLTETVRSDYDDNAVEEVDQADRLQFRGTQGGTKLNANSDMLLCMGASAFSKVIAITAAYPHEVARTRMRERGNKYRTFVGTLLTVLQEEGWRGLYRGLGTHYIRQVPNSCIMIGTYEWVVYLLYSCNLVSSKTSGDGIICDR